MTLPGASSFATEPVMALIVLCWLFAVIGTVSGVVLLVRWLWKWIRK